mmetsp:Transcript_58219/g.152329  ORF Transcript_58219/g.152329 Transcript_58219/m.152329 type:complete len:482 (+) Transcript_58219:1744-3189(+)
MKPEQHRKAGGKERQQQDGKLRHEHVQVATRNDQRNVRIPATGQVHADARPKNNEQTHQDDEDDHDGPIRLRSHGVLCLERHLREVAGGELCYLLLGVCDGEHRHVDLTIRIRAHGDLHGHVGCKPEHDWQVVGIQKSTFSSATATHGVAQCKAAHQHVVRDVAALVLPHRAVEVQIRPALVLDEVENPHRHWEQCSIRIFDEQVIEYRISPALQDVLQGHAALRGQAAGEASPGEGRAQRLHRRASQIRTEIELVAQALPTEPRAPKRVLRQPKLQRIRDIRPPTGLVGQRKLPLERGVCDDLRGKLPLVEQPRHTLEALPLAAAGQVDDRLALVQEVRQEAANYCGVFVEHEHTQVGDALASGRVPVQTTHAAPHVEPLDGRAADRRRVHARRVVKAQHVQGVVPGGVDAQISPEGAVSEPRLPVVDQVPERHHLRGGDRKAVVHQLVVRHGDARPALLDEVQAVRARPPAMIHRRGLP